MSAAETVRERSRVSGCESCKAREDRIVGHLATFRRRSRITAHQEAQVRFVDVDVPSQQPPNTTVSADVQLANDALLIGPNDPDRCSTGFAGRVGLEVDLELTVNGSFADRRTGICVPSTGQTATLQFVTPSEPGIATIEVTGELPGKDLSIGSRTATIDVVEGVPEAPTNGDDDGGTGPLLPCFLDPNRQCSPFEQLAFGGAAFFLVFLLAAAR